MQFTAITFSALSLLALTAAQDTTSASDLVTSIAAETSLVTSAPTVVASSGFGPIAGNSTGSGVAGGASGSAASGGAGGASGTKTGSGSGTDETGSPSSTGSGDAAESSAAGDSGAAHLAGPQVVIGAIAGAVGVLGIFAL